MSRLGLPSFLRFDLNIITIQSSQEGLTANLFFVSLISGLLQEKCDAKE